MFDVLTDREKIVHFSSAYANFLGDGRDSYFYNQLSRFVYYLRYESYWFPRLGLLAEGMVSLDYKEYFILEGVGLCSKDVLVNKVLDLVRVSTTPVDTIFEYLVSGKGEVDFTSLDLAHLIFDVRSLEVIYPLSLFEDGRLGHYFIRTGYYDSEKLPIVTYLYKRSDGSLNFLISYYEDDITLNSYSLDLTGLDFKLVYDNSLDIVFEYSFDLDSCKGVSSKLEGVLRLLSRPILVSVRDTAVVNYSEEEDDVRFE